VIVQNKNLINTIKMCPIILGKVDRGLSVFTFLSDCPEKLIVQHTSVCAFSLSILRLQKKKKMVHCQ